VLHADNICFFLQNEFFLERTEETINRLSRSAEEMTSLADGLTQLQTISAIMTNTMYSSFVSFILFVFPLKQKM